MTGTKMPRQMLSAIACLLCLSAVVLPQQPDAANTTTLIGCLSGPDTDNAYTLSSMQHRGGVQVVGTEELKSGSGAKVKLTGSWEQVSGTDGKKRDETRRFRATSMTIVEEKCKSPAPVTPVSKKKQTQQK